MWKNSIPNNFDIRYNWRASEEKSLQHFFGCDAMEVACLSRRRRCVTHSLALIRCFVGEVAGGGDLSVSCQDRIEKFLIHGVRLR